MFRVGADLQRSGNKRDFFAPTDWRSEDARDEHLGGSNPLPLNVPGRNGNQALILALGKDRKAYLLDRNNLGGIGGHQLRVGGVIGDHRDLGGAGQQVDPHPAEQLALGLGDECVAWSHDHVDRGYRTRPGCAVGTPTTQP